MLGRVEPARNRRHRPDARKAKVDDNKPWIALFDRQTRSENLTGFQVGPVEQKAEADFQVILMSDSLKIAQTNTRVLFVAPND